MKERRPIAVRFWEKVKKTDSCWEWIAAKDTKGYGMLGGAGNKIRRSHRVAWELERGPIPPGMCVCHHCDNRACVRPDHLFLGTHIENMQDMSRKGRGVKNTWTRGSRNPTVKLDDRIVLHEILPRLRAGETQRSIADSYGVCDATINHIATGFCWSHVTGIKRGV